MSKFVPIILALLVLSSCANMVIAPKATDSGTLGLIKCESSKEINEDYPTHYRLYVRDSAGNETHLDLDPARRGFGHIKTLPPGTHTIYKNGGFSGTQYLITVCDGHDAIVAKPNEDDDIAGRHTSEFQNDR